jgi:hypothetical protein
VTQVSNVVPGPLTCMAELLGRHINPRGITLSNVSQDVIYTSTTEIIWTETKLWRANGQTQKTMVIRPSFCMEHLSCNCNNRPDTLYSSNVPIQVLQHFRVSGKLSLSITQMFPVITTLQNLFSQYDNCNTVRRKWIYGTFDIWTLLCRRCI